MRAPVIASWKFGAGKTLAVTTDASGRWSSRWVENGVFGPLWDKLIAWMTPETGNAAQKFDVALGYRAGRIEIKLTDYGDDSVATLGGGRSTRWFGCRTDRGRRPSFRRTPPVRCRAAWRPPRPATITSSSSGHRPAAATRPFPPLAYTVSPADRGGDRRARRPTTVLLERPRVGHRWTAESVTRRTRDVAAAVRAQRLIRALAGSHGDDPADRGGLDPAPNFLGSGARSAAGGALVLRA